jgi:hypothetical protein
VIREFRFEVMAQGKLCRSLDLEGSLPNLSVFGVIHDCLEHGVGGFPFGFDGEMMALGSAFRRSDVGAAFASKIARSLWSYGGAVFEGENVMSPLPGILDQIDSHYDVVRINAAVLYVEEVKRQTWGFVCKAHHLERIRDLICAGYLVAQHRLGLTNANRMEFEAHVNRVGESLTRSFERIDEPTRVSVFVEVFPNHHPLLSYRVGVAAPAAVA